YASTIIGLSGEFLAADGEVDMNDSVDVSIDLTGVPRGVPLLLSFDLLGFGRVESYVTIETLVLDGEGETSISLQLDPACDSGAPGDGITRHGVVDLVGTTDPGLTVRLDVDGDGFDDGTATADGNGNYRFENVVLMEGVNTIQVQTTVGLG